MITLTRGSLMRALEALAPIVARGGSDERFRHVLLEANPDMGVRLVAIASDYSLVGERAVQDAGIHDECEVLLPHGDLLKITKNTPGDELRLEAEDGTATARAGRTRYDLPVLRDALIEPAPLDGATERCVFSGRELSEALGEVAYALPRDDTRPALNAVLLEDTGSSLRLVCTSGRQFAMHAIELRAGSFSPVEPWRISIPAAAVSVVRGFFGTAEDVRLLVAEDSSYALFQGERGSLRVRLLAEPYPQIDVLVNQPTTASVTVARADLLAAASRAVALCGDEGGVDLLFADERLTLRGERFHDEVDAAGDATAFRYTARRLKAALEKVKGERVVLERRGNAMVYLQGGFAGLHGFSRIIGQEGKT